MLLSETLNEYNNKENNKEYSSNNHIVKLTGESFHSKITQNNTDTPNNSILNLVILYADWCRNSDREISNLENYIINSSNNRRDTESVLSNTKKVKLYKINVSKNELENIHVNPYGRFPLYRLFMRSKMYEFEGFEEYSNREINVIQKLELFVEKYIELENLSK